MDLQIKLKTQRSGNGAPNGLIVDYTNLLFQPLFIRRSDLIAEHNRIAGQSRRCHSAEAARRGWAAVAHPAAMALFEHAHRVFR